MYFIRLCSGGLSPVGSAEEAQPLSLQRPARPAQRTSVRAFHIEGRWRPGSGLCTLRPQRCCREPSPRSVRGTGEQRNPAVILPSVRALVWKHAPRRALCGHRDDVWPSFHPPPTAPGWVLQLLAAQSTRTRSRRQREIVLPAGNGRI